MHVWASDRGLRCLDKDWSKKTEDQTLILLSHFCPWRQFHNYSLAKPDSYFSCQSLALQDYSIWWRAIDRDIEAWRWAMLYLFLKPLQWDNSPWDTLGSSTWIEQCQLHKYKLQLCTFTIPFHFPFHTCYYILLGFMLCLFIMITHYVIDDLSKIMMTVWFLRMRPPNTGGICISMYEHKLLSSPPGGVLPQSTGSNSESVWLGHTISLHLWAFLSTRWTKMLWSNQKSCGVLGKQVILYLGSPLLLLACSWVICVNALFYSTSSASLLRF